MTEYRLSERADADLSSIFVYGFEQFGERQAARYFEELKGVFDKLAQFRKMGRRADSIRNGLRRHEHGSHVIFYVEESEGIVIVAVVHARSLRGLDL